MLQPKADEPWVRPGKQLKIFLYHTIRLISRRPEAERNQLLEHFLLVRGRPVEAPAFWARGELLLGGKHIGRNFSFDLLLGNRLKQGVTFHAARKGVRERVKAKCLDRLFELIAKSIALNKEVLRWILLPDGSVSGEDQPPFFSRAADQSITGEVLAIGYILADDPEPSRKSPKHPIGGELLFMRSFFRHRIADRFEKTGSSG